MTDNTNSPGNPDTNPPQDQPGNFSESAHEVPTDSRTPETGQTDPRRLAAERLSYLAVLQFQNRRRGRRGAEPWRDPRHGQGRVLALLKLKPEMTQRELTYLMGMSRQSIAELLRKLEDQGLVERTPSQEDRRAVLVTLTEAGREIDQRDPDRSSGTGLLDFLSDEEAATLADLLGRVIEELEERAGIDVEHRREMVAEFWRSRAGGRHPHGGPGQHGGPEQHGVPGEHGGPHPRGDRPEPPGFPDFPGVPGFPGFGPWGGPGGAPVPPPEGCGGPHGHGPDGHGPREHGPYGHGPDLGPRWGGDRPGR